MDHFNKLTIIKEQKSTSTGNFVEFKYHNYMISLSSLKFWLFFGDIFCLLLPEIRQEIVGSADLSG